MYHATAAVVGALALLNLLLTFGVIRRLRGHTDQLAKLANPHADTMLPAGAQVGQFATTTTHGEPVSTSLLAGRTLVGFFSPGCPACEVLLPSFVEYATTMPGGRQQVLAVVAGGSDQAPAKVEALSRCARVVRADYDDAVIRAFGVNAYPAVCMVEADGTVTVAAADLAGFPAPATV
jgi:thiol-disulfide isomerase/thioredoxin